MLFCLPKYPESDSCQQLTDAPTGIAAVTPMASRQPVALGEGGAPGRGNDSDKPTDSGSGGGGGGAADEDALQARLDALRRG